MQWRAGSALSPSVVRVDSQMRPCDVRESIEGARATHAVVFQGGICRGLVSAPEALKYAPQRPFAELLSPRPPASISCDLPLDEAVGVLLDSDVDAAVVLDEEGAHAGVVTRQSLLAALLARNKQRAERATRLWTVLDDVPARKIEQALRESEQRLQQVVNNAPVVLFSVDRNGVFTLSEGKALEGLGLRPGEVVGMSAFELYADNPVIVRGLEKVLRGEKNSVEARDRDRVYTCQYSPTVGADGSITGAIGVATDVTESRQAERQSRRLLDELAQTGRISTMGEMASGLAHELNQPLAAIVAYVDACQELVESGKMDGRQLSTVLRSVSSQAERAGQIIHRLRKMIRRSQPVRAGMNVNDTVREVAELLESEARQAGAAIDLDLADDLPEIEADFLQVQHVVLNLVRNGLEAMKGVPADQRQLTIATGRTAAGEVEIAVHDLGHGLGGARPDQLFEPFFTTKPGGMGLGLSISRTIVEAHGGRISMTANSPRGATARFTLPPGSGKAVHDEKTDRVHR